MIRRAFITAFIFLIAGGAYPAYAVEKIDPRGNKHTQAMVTKVDSTKSTIAIKTLATNGQKRERTLRLSHYVKLIDDAEKETTLGAFQPGEEVCVTEKNDEVILIRKHTRGRITDVDTQDGTITMKVTDKDGREDERTFRLVEDTEYIDSNGRITVRDMLRAGNDVFFVETDGKITGIKKADAQ